ncbi:hypothetical protein CNR27_03965 [Luteimonas chenhongjianii]|uniref:GAF domain-containing protein n=1 Tax=Luteimonas chenhongjianii TaxID=2006110 RepID=A0A290XCN2_9GAMM|nr:hypothetical protein [Luteimonas chenhongjianii]ATD66706.1 hypothetical protein CNR27_03965 [Luteimonas chenhongjianii]
MERASNGFLDQLRFLVSSGNLLAALEHLNLQSGLRFTALYRYAGVATGDFLLVDRDDSGRPTAEWMQRHELCRSFVEAMADMPAGDDASPDLTCVEHPLAALVQAYCSLPLCVESGAIFGLLCQFDMAPIVIQPSTIALMRELAAALNPRSVREARRTYFEGRVDRLSDMQDLIAAAADAGDDARQMFDSFADPLRAEAFRKLEPDDALAIEARISAIWSNVDARP